MAEKSNAEGPKTAESQTKKRPGLGTKSGQWHVSKGPSNKVPKPAKSEDGHFVFEFFDDINGRYIILEKLGQGSFGQVLLCWDDTSKRHVAVKVSGGFALDREAARNEIETLSCLAAVQSERTRGSFVEILDYFEYGDHMCIVLEKLELSLFQVLKRNGYSPFPIDQVREFGAQLLESVAILHEIEFIHTDLKPANVVLVSGETKRYSTRPMDERVLPESCDIKLIDFGTSVPGDRTHFSIVGTRSYRAPEIILGLGWTYPCDIWSIGCLLVELATGYVLFSVDNDLEHLARMERVLGPLPEHMVKKKARRIPDKYFSQGRVNLQTVSPARLAIMEKICPLEELVSKHFKSPRSSSFVDLLKGLLKYDPEERLTARQALDHPFFKNQT